MLVHPRQGDLKIAECLLQSNVHKYQILVTNLGQLSVCDLGLLEVGSLRKAHYFQHWDHVGTRLQGCYEKFSFIKAELSWTHHHIALVNIATRSLSTRIKMVPTRTLRTLEMHMLS